MEQGTEGTTASKLGCCVASNSQHLLVCSEHYAACCNEPVLCCAVLVLLVYRLSC